MKPIPEALYPCAICREDYSWPPEDLFWSGTRNQWFCIECWDSEHHGEKVTSLAEELKRSGEPRLAVSVEGARDDHPHAGNHQPD